MICTFCNGHYFGGEMCIRDMICKEDGIIGGLQIFERTFELLDEACDVEFFASDGDHVEKGQLLGRVKGDVRVLLSGEQMCIRDRHDSFLNSQNTHKQVKHKENHIFHLLIILLFYQKHNLDF